MNFDDMRYKTSALDIDITTDISIPKNKNRTIDEVLSSTSVSSTKGDYLISPNIFRALRKVKNDETGMFIVDLVDPTIRKDFKELFNIAEDNKEEFSITKEFQDAYQIVKQNLVNNSDDTQLLNTTQRFLQFMLNNELKINGVDAVKAFKEAVFSVLDDTDSKLKDKVIEKFNTLVEV